MDTINLDTISFRNAVLLAGVLLSLIIVLSSGYLALGPRPRMRAYDDFLIPSAIFLVIVGAVTTFAYLFLPNKGIGSVRVPLMALTVVVSVFGIVFTFVTGSVQNRWNARQQLYQTLEIQSILLFRFENDNEDRVRSLWKKNLAPTDKVEQFCVKEYICQILNLFEMAVRFQLQGVLPRNVFGSWVIWMWELCTREVFHHFWLDPDDLPFNYVGELRRIITEGVRLAREPDCKKCEAAQRSKFFDFVADSLNSPEIRNWFNKADIEALERLRTTDRRPP
jgi:hypothetical protein